MSKAKIEKLLRRATLHLRLHGHKMTPSDRYGCDFCDKPNGPGCINTDEYFKHPLLIATMDLIRWMVIAEWSDWPDRAVRNKGKYYCAEWVKYVR